MSHDPTLVLLSIAMAALGGHVGFGLAARFREARGGSRRLLLAGAAGALGLGIWTMHFVGMLAADLPSGVGYAVLPTLISFLVCVLVVGVAIFFVADGRPSSGRLALGATAMGTGISTMHYVGMSALRGVFCAGHDPWLVAASVAVGIAVSAGALLPFASRARRLPVATGALLFGLAVSGMHYTAMAGMMIDLVAICSTPLPGELVVGEGELAIAVAVMGFLVAGIFLLFLVPDGSREPAVATLGPGFADGFQVTPPRAGGAALPPRIPVRGRDGIRLLAPEQVHAIRAEAHYTSVYDGEREWLCDWSISEAETRLAPFGFRRCHRSHLVALDRVSGFRRAGKGALLEIGGRLPREVPVSRTRLALVRDRLTGNGEA